MNIINLLIKIKLKNVQTVPEYLLEEGFNYIKKVVNKINLSKS